MSIFEDRLAAAANADRMHAKAPPRHSLTAETRGAPTQWNPEREESTSPMPSMAPERRYQSRHVLGRGGMGEVRLAADSIIGRDVAVKALASHLSDSPDARDRFLREVRVQGRLEHPAIVPVYDVGTDERGDLYFSMKHVSGRTLDDILDELTRDDSVAVTWTLPRLLGVFRQVCLAVEYAHSRGVIHRDLKPANVMVGDFGQVYVLDWGIAKDLNRAARRESIPDMEPPRDADAPASLRTRGGELLGTPGYMAPEQITQAALADQRCDVYSLGAILFEILTLERLHRGDSTDRLVRSTHAGADAHARHRAPHRNVPPELDAACVRATASDPEERYGSVHELTAALERYVEGDRDLELRRDLAARHADAAERAATLALAGGPDANAQRARALAEAGRALALDADVPGAVATVVQLMQVPPTEIPPDVSHETGREEVTVWVSIVRDTAYIYTAFFLICASLFWLGVRSWVGVLAILVPLGIAIAACAYTVWVKGTSESARRLRIPVLVTTAAAIAAASGLGGALVLVPTLAVAVCTGGGLWLEGRLQRRINIGVHAAAIVVPFLLEWTGVLPRSYIAEDGAFITLPVVVSLPEIPVRIALVIASVAALVGSTLFAYRATDVARGVRLRLALQSWHLRQLATLKRPDSRRSHDDNQARDTTT